MKLLAIETSSTACSVAILVNEQIHKLHRIAPMQQTQLILPMIDELLKVAAIELKELNAIAFGCGPGSFTGVRIATSVAQGLGFAANIPLIPVSSLAALAQETYTELGWQKMLVAIDARVQEIYWGAYVVNSQGLVELLGKEALLAPEEIAAPDLTEWAGIGNAWEIYQKHIRFHPMTIDATRIPTASGVLMLARDKYARQEWVEPERALPTYLRDEVAKKGK